MSGVVVDAVTGAPLDGVRIEAATRRATTDAEGRFVLDRLGTGRLLLQGSKDSYTGLLMDAYGSSDAVSLTLVPGQDVSGLVLRMLPAGIASGSIHGANGEPLRNAAILPCRYTYDPAGMRRPICPTTGLTQIASVMSALRARYRFQEELANIADSTRSDDRGEFRMRNVKPGDYVFYIAPAAGTPFFYPGVLEARDAEILSIPAGREIRLRPIVPPGAGPMATLRVRLADETDAMRQTAAAFRLWRSGSDSPFFSQSHNSIPQTVQIANIPPGAYDLEVFWLNRDGALSISSGRQSLYLSGQDMEVTVTVRLGAELTGSVSIATHEETVEAVGGVTLFWTSDRLSPDLIIPFSADAGGSLTVRSLPDGVYTLHSASGIPANACLQSITANGSRNVLTDGLEASGSPLALEVRLSNNFAVVQGNVTTAAGGIARGATVAMVPEGPAASSRHVVETSDQDGRFELRCVPPGAYRLYSWTSMEGAAYRNSEFMQAFREHGIPVTVQEGDRMEISIPVL